MDNVFALLSTQLADAVERAASAVVPVSGPGWRPACGVVIAPDRVLTFQEDADHEGLSVRGPGGAVHPAVHAGHDPTTGLALLRVDGLQAPPAAPAAGLPRTGSLVLALGRGFSGTVVAASGVVSSVGGPLRTGAGPAIPAVIRTDITPYGGFAGGALVDPDGRVVGLMAGARIRGLAVTIPAGLAWEVGQALEKHGRIRRGYLGVASQSVRIPERQRGGQPSDRGLLVVGVGRDTPAEQAGLLVGDIVIDFDGRAVRTPEQLLGLLSGERVGARVPLRVLRGGALEAVEAVVGERQSRDEA